MVTVSGGVGGDRSLTAPRIPRTRGAASGVLVVLLGIWGGLVPFVGASFGYAYTPNENWTMTWGRLWLELVPGAVAIVAGVVLIGCTTRSLGMLAGWIAAIAGAWFAIGPVVSRLATGESRAGAPVASSTTQAVLEEVGMFTGLGVVIVFFAAVAVGRFSVLPKPVAESPVPVGTAPGDYAPRHGVTEEEPTERT